MASTAIVIKCISANKRAILLSESCILKNGSVSTVILYDPFAKGYSSLASSKQSITLFSFPNHPGRKIDNFNCSWALRPQL